ncbi:hypothetical protein [Acinetobacter pittii]|uniref:hypothetical protein n=1 Tax=Acinetobacter pittii TaxID=48296 RepID=UPI001F24F7AD|nr:hypothetical protein [Acinetobacter pittii]MCE6234822.1 hypothetical protein [Acinetobacter pittii]MCE6690480.1 hypothetical protein [Acinetobacter pittii]MCE6697028.1 hypothetical protein [Acinetobacter pittii]
MDDLISVAATIQGAQIQANYALWAAVIGGAFLLVSIWITAKSTLKAHKIDKLAEAKRDIYLDLVRNWQNFMMAVFSFINVNKNVYDENFSLALTELIASLHETSFISDPLTKEKVLDFTMQLIEDLFKIKYYGTQFYDFEGNEPERLRIQIEVMDFMRDYGIKALDLQRELRIEIGLKEDEIVNQRILKKQQKFYENIRLKLKDFWEKINQENKES